MYILLVYSMEDNFDSIEKLVIGLSDIVSDKKI